MKLRGENRAVWGVRSVATLACAASVACVLGACNSREAQSKSTGSATTSEALRKAEPGATDAIALGKLSPEAQLAVTRSPVGVLVPSDPALLASGTVMADKSWYAFHAQTSGVTIAIQGTNVAHVHPEVAPDDGNTILRRGRGYVTVNEGIRTASFIEDGVAYAVDVECATAGDPHCASDAYVLELTNGLVKVGGGTR
jgi:hypothetical protein